MSTYYIFTICNKVKKRIPPKKRFLKILKLNAYDYKLYEFIKSISYNVSIQKSGFHFKDNDEFIV